MFRQGHVNTGKKDKGYFLSVYPYFSFLFFYSRILLTLKAIGDTEVTHERPLFSFSEKPMGFFPKLETLTKLISKMPTIHILKTLTKPFPNTTELFT